VRRAATLALALIVALAPGCASVGPATIARDRVDYDQAITASWKRSMLLNMVKLRYADTPMFLDVASVINSYTLEGQVNAGIGWPGGEATGNAGGFAHFADKPTITYNPLLGERFTRSLMTPMQPGVVISLIQSGWSADMVMRMMVSSANGINNRFGAGGRARAADPAFAEVTAAMRRIQASGAVGMRVTPDKGQELTVLVLPRKDLPENVARDIAALRGLLGIEQGATEIRVVYGSVPLGGSQLALVVTRSMLEILLDISSAIDVPADDVRDGVAPAPASFPGDGEGYRPLIRIRSGERPPERPFVAVQYQGHWFWIDANDYNSKVIFSFVMIMFSLMDTAAPRGQPIVTVPAG
jgi:hypothetical protein